jgi:hypothetical protein
LVHHKKDHISFHNGSLSLETNRREQVIVWIGLKPARVDEQYFNATVSRDPVMSVPGDTRAVVYQCLTRSRKTIEQC